MILNAACDVESARTSILLAEKYDFIYASVGIHPHQSEAAKDNDFNIIRALTKHKKVKAIGEIGLDYHYDFSPREIQKQWLEKQLQLACELDLPVIIHEREAAFDCFEKIKRFPLRGVYHCYSGSAEMANEILKRGFYISFTGSITFANANRLREVVKRIPLDRMLIETDSPYLEMCIRDR